MSTVKTTNLQHPSASDVGITLGADGSVVLPQGFAGGLGTNVVQTVKTDAFTTTSTSYTTVTGLSVAITPTSDTSKILVLAQISYAGGALNVGTGFFKVTRGGTDIYVGDADASRVQTVFGGSSNADRSQEIDSAFICFLDSPATASSVTYQVEIRRPVTGNISINRSNVDGNNAGVGRGASSITVIEVAA